MAYKMQLLEGLEQSSNIELHQSSFKHYLRNHHLPNHIYNLVKMPRYSSVLSCLLSATAIYVLFYHESRCPFYFSTEALISLACPKKATALNRPTFKIPNSDEYLIELEIFHQLHCLNQLREAFYPDRFTNRWQNTKDMLSPSTSHILPAFQFSPHTYNTFNQMVATS